MVYSWPGFDWVVYSWPGFDWVMYSWPGFDRVYICMGTPQTEVKAGGEGVLLMK